MAKRIAMCWKCQHGYEMKRIVDMKIHHTYIFCTLTAYVVADHSNPPDGCPVKEGWKLIDAEDEE